MKSNYLTFMSVCLLTSCSFELADETNNNITSDIDKVTLYSKPFVYEDDTRTNLTPTDKSIVFSWSSTDAIGVFPIKPTTNSQAKQELQLPADCENDAHYASFDGAGWGLRDGNTYAAYTPYNGKLTSETPYTDVPIDMTGQDGTLATIGEKYDYMYAPSKLNEESCSTNSSHVVVFDFEHAVAIVELKLTMPVAATWKGITIANADGKKVWTTNATMNVADGTIKSTETSASISATFKNVTTTSGNKQLTLYIAVLPTITESLTLTATTIDGAEYTAKLASKNIVHGKAYRWTASLAAVQTPGNGREWIDLGLPSGLKWATMNVGATNPGDYGEHYGGSVSKEYDAATKYWGGAWRTPTRSEMEELVNCCYWVWTSNYNGTNKAGYIVYKVKSSSDKGQIVTSDKTPSSSYSLSDSHIFLPAAGSCWETEDVDFAGTDGYYWSSTPTEIDSWYFWSLKFSPDGVGFNKQSAHHFFLSVLAVCM